MGGIDSSGVDDKNKGEVKIVILAYIVMAIVGCDVSLVQIAMVCHCIPSPSGVFSDPTHIIPVVSRTRIVHHVV